MECHKNEWINVPFLPERETCTLLNAKYSEKEGTSILQWITNTQDTEAQGAVDDSKEKNDNKLLYRAAIEPSREPHLYTQWASF